MRYCVSSSAIRLVSVVTSTRSLARRRLADHADQVVDLPLDRPDLDHRIEQARRPDHLLDDHAARPLQLVGRRGRRDVDPLPHPPSNSSKVSGRLSSAEGRRKP